MKRYAIGLDFGTNSCRSLVVDLLDGRELASHVSDYRTGQEGIWLDPRDPNVARQNPADYLTGMQESVRGALKEAEKADPSFGAEAVVGMASTPQARAPCL